MDVSLVISILWLSYFNLGNCADDLELDGAEICQNDCGKTFPLHTSDKVDSNWACLRGCRLSKIVQFTSSSRNKDFITSICNNDCTDAYGKGSDLQYACHVGCKYQVIIQSPTMMNHDDKDADWGILFDWPAFNFRPTLMFQQYWKNVIGKTNTFLSIQSSYSIDEEEGNTVVLHVESSPWIYEKRKVDLPFMFVDNKEDDIAKPNDESYEKSLWVRAMRHSSNWLHCVEAKAGIPRWMLLSVLLLSFLCVYFMLCSVIVDGNNEKMHEFNRELTIKADDLQKAPIFTMENVEAGPLPDKKNLLNI